MKKRNVGLVLLATAVVLVGLLAVQAQRRASSGKNEKVILPDESQRIAAANYTLSGPYSYKNLSIFLIHSPDQAKGKTPLTLQEAMAQKKIVVHETGDVNQLAIENVSDDEVFVQSGDIVKGGQQDRVLALDLMVPPKSGKVSIEAFCVEQGRWNSRGNESVVAFSSSEKTLNSKDLKIAAKHKSSQSEVWDKVAQSQEKMSAGVVASSLPADPITSPPSTAGGGGGNAADRAGVAGGEAVAVSFDYSVASLLSSSSLQLSLENKRLEQTAKDYVEKLSPVVKGKNDVIGYAFAINGAVNSADVYSSHELFKKLWPKLLEASATEAISEFDKWKTYKPVEAEVVKTFLNEAETGKADTNEVTSRVTMIKRETEKNLFFETRDRKQSGNWIHRNYLTK
jgi:hypothetical protein